MIHEVLLNDRRVGPVGAAAMGISMLLWTSGQQFSARDLSKLLREPGFTQIKRVRTYGNWSVVTGRKPGSAER
jgi:acetylserotonin N-methyltransferase